MLVGAAVARASWRGVCLCVGGGGFAPCALVGLHHARNRQQQQHVDCNVDSFLA
jgi:hypothetical protein